MEGYLFILPKLILFVGLLVFPMLASLYVSLTDWTMLRQAVFVGLRNYLHAFSDPVFWQALGNTFRYALSTVPAYAVLSLALAIFFNRSLAGVGVFRAAAFIPVVASMTVAATIWRYLYNPDFGLFNAILGRAGLPPVLWLGNPTIALYSVAVVIIWQNVGFYMIIFLAGLQGIPTAFYEAARIDGATAWQSFWRITLPLMRPTLFVVVVVSTIWCFQIFPAPYILTGGGPNNATISLVQYIYSNGFEYYEMGYASAIGYLLLLIIVALSLVQRKLLGGQDWEY